MYFPGEKRNATDDVTREGDLLYAPIPTLAPRVKLRSLGGLHFSWAPVDTGATVEFERAGARKATAFVIHGPNGPPVRAHRAAPA